MALHRSRAPGNCVPIKQDAATAQITIRVPSMHTEKRSFMRRLAKSANEVRERRGPAFADDRIVSALGGWSPSAPRMGNCFDFQWYRLSK